MKVTFHLCLSLLVSKLHSSVSLQCITRVSVAESKRPATVVERSLSCPAAAPMYFLFSCYRFDCMEMRFKR